MFHPKARIKYHSNGFSNYLAKCPTATYSVNIGTASITQTFTICILLALPIINTLYRFSFMLFNIAFMVVYIIVSIYNIMTESNINGLIGIMKIVNSSPGSALLSFQISPQRFPAGSANRTRRKWYQIPVPKLYLSFPSIH